MSSRSLQVGNGSLTFAQLRKLGYTQAVRADLTTRRQRLTLVFLARLVDGEIALFHVLLVLLAFVIHLFSQPLAHVGKFG
jgi:hypothetical protein